MKFKTTQKAIRANYPTIIKVGYCDLQTLLAHKNPIAYTVRAEGWACDLYEVSSTVCISTGYAPFGNVKSWYDVNRKYEKEAEKIRYGKMPYNEQVEALNGLIEEYVKEVMEG